MRTSGLLILAALLVIPLLAGCNRGARVGVPVAGLEVDQEFGPTVHVDNFSGSVTVIADPRVREPQVSARVRSQDRRSTWSKRDVLNLVDVQADSSIENGRRTLRVVTSPITETERVTVDVTVRVSRTEGIRVVNAGGPVELVRVSGPVTVLNGAGGAPGGDISLRTGAPMTAPVTLTTSAGNVLYQVGPMSSGAFELISEDGRAEFYAKVGKITNVQPQESRYRAVLNDGTNSVLLRTGSGTARVVVIENADTYGPDRWDGYPRWPQYPRPIGRLGGYHNEEPPIRRAAPRE
jgi:hypothetical protein